MNFNITKILFSTFILSAFITCSGYAQKYKTIADTAKLNKEYAGLTADIAELNTKLTAAKNKTADYQEKSNQKAKDAVAAAEESKSQAATASNGDIKAIKKELKKAKKANNEAEDAKDAKSDEKANQKQIEYLTKQIEKKQSKLAELDKERAAILAQPAATVNQ